jgi:hypothetical protein
MWRLAAPVLPAFPFEGYANGLLGDVATVIGTVLPYAATVTAFAIGVAMIRRWIGHRSATSLGQGPRSSSGKRERDADAFMLQGEREFRAKHR